MNEYRIKYCSDKFPHEARVFIFAENEENNKQFQLLLKLSKYLQPALLLRNQEPTRLQLKSKRIVCRLV